VTIYRRGLLVLCLVLALPATTRADSGVILPGDIQQGQLVVGTAPIGATVTFEGEALTIAPNGQFVFGFNRDAGADSVLQVTYADGVTEQMPLTIRARDYDIQRIDGLPPSKVSPPAAVQERLRIERGKVASARGQVSDRLAWSQPFVWPAYGTVTGVYGSQRVLNDVPKRPHFGLDVAGPVGTPVYAPAAGKAVLSEADFYYEGGIIIIDHGFGVMSTMFHMNSVDVANGTEVAQGDQVGTIGATGRATGPHVDWRINWNGRRLDPRLLVGAMPSKDPYAR
jgi:murein DD-endopeptidase MepM/ murein hydrolase activator NlpD